MRRVRDLFEAFDAAGEDICNALDHFVQEAGLQGEAAAQVFLAAGVALQMAMRARAEEARTGRRAGSQDGGPR